MPLLAGARQANAVASMDGVEPRQTIVDPGVTAGSVLVMTCLNRPRIGSCSDLPESTPAPTSITYRPLSCLEAALRLIRICVYPET